MFDEYGNTFEISLPTNDDKDVELHGYMLSQYESAIANIATRFLDMEININKHSLGK
mgnify:CR=1 FL=1|jgi:hypothetical protein